MLIITALKKINHLVVFETHFVFSPYSPPCQLHFLSLVFSPAGRAVSEAGLCPLGRRLPLCPWLAVALRRSRNPWWPFLWRLPPWQQAAGVGMTLSPWLGSDVG